MQLPLIINRPILPPREGVNYAINMSRRFAFSVCLDGDIDIEILNRSFHIGCNSIMICLPFTNLKILNVKQPSDIMLVEINRENIIGLSPLHRSILIHNLLLIRQQPVVITRRGEIMRIKAEVGKYLDEIKSGLPDLSDKTSAQIYQSVIETRSQLIISQLLKLYFNNVPGRLSSNDSRNTIFQRFMLDIYSNYKQHHNVSFYAMRSGLSPKYFSTSVRNISGASASQWIESIILSETQSMLRNPAYNIKDIAIALNFPDAATFTRYIYRISGMTPKAPRKTLMK